MEDWEGFADYHNHFLLMIYIWEAIKTVTTKVLAWDLLADYQLLDCLLLGRTRTFGHQNRIGPTFLLIFRIMFFIYRFYLTKIRPGEFRFPVLEFVLQERSVVIANELAAHHGEPSHCETVPSMQADVYLLHEANRHRFARQKRGPMNGGSLLSQLLVAPSRARPYLTSGKARRSAESHRRPDRSNERSKLFQIRNPFEAQADASQADGSVQRWILRPNRTSKSWFRLQRFAIWTCCISIYSISINIMVAIFITVASIITPMGFEIHYQTCVRYLKRVQAREWAARNLSLGQEHELSYAGMYMAFNKTLACDMDIMDTPIVQFWHDDPNLVQANAYSLARIAFDVIDNVIFYFDFTLYFLAQSYLLFMVSYDLILNSNEIRRQLLAMNKRLRGHTPCGPAADPGRPLLPLSSNSASDLEHDLASTSSYLSFRREREPSSGLAPAWGATSGGKTTAPAGWEPAGRVGQDRRLVGDISTLQTTLIDHFKLVRTYNAFVSPYFFLLLLTLGAISITYIVHIFTIRSGAITLEFLFTQLSSLVMVIYLLSLSSLAHLYSARLHPLVASTMALDNTNSLTKLRWVTIMKHFHPKPMFCFTLVHKTEISLLFCLKLISWVFTSILVLASYLHVYQTKTGKSASKGPQNLMPW